jgi:hypothetical protein
MFINLIWIFKKCVQEVSMSEFFSLFVKFVFTLFIFAQYCLWWGQNEGTASHDWRHANILSSGWRGQGQSKQDPRHWCLHTCWFKCHTNRFPPQSRCYTFNLSLPDNIPFTCTEEVTYEQLFSGLRQSFWSYCILCARFKVFTAVSIKIQVF